MILMLSWYVFLFIIGGVFGVLLETLAVSVTKRRWIYRGNSYWRGFPFIPMYAFGTDIVYIMIKNMSDRPAVGVILLITLVASIWEYVGGVFCVKILRRRLWDYRKHWGNLEGHVSILSATWWLILVTCFYYFGYETLRYLEMNWMGF